MNTFNNSDKIRAIWLKCCSVHLGAQGLSDSLTGVEETNSFHRSDRNVFLEQPGRDSTGRVCLCTTRFHCAHLSGGALSARQRRYHNEVLIQFKFKQMACWMHLK